LHTGISLPCPENRLISAKGSALSTKRLVCKSEKLKLEKTYSGENVPSGWLSSIVTVCAESAKEKKKTKIKNNILQGGY